MKNIALVLLMMLFCAAWALSGQEIEPAKDPFILFIPVSYDYARLEEQTLHSPVAVIGFMLGKQGVPFNEVERRFLGIAQYQPFIFTETLQDNLPKQFHGISAMLDGRIKRHQILAIFQTISDRPMSGLNTFNIGAGWGYEVIRKTHVSLILGAALMVGDLNIMGISSPVLPMPFFRFGLDTKWFVSSIEYVGYPHFAFTVAPKERIRFTADMQMQSYGSIADLNCNFTLWYRLFTAAHKMGDFAGIGAGFKNEVLGFNLSNEYMANTFGLQKASVFAAVELFSAIQIQGGWVINSNYLIDGKKAGGAGNGFFLSISGMIPIIMKM